VSCAKQPGHPCIDSFISLSGNQPAGVPRSFRLFPAPARPYKRGTESERLGPHSSIRWDEWDCRREIRDHYGQNEFVFRPKSPNPPGHPRLMRLIQVTGQGTTRVFGWMLTRCSVCAWGVLEISQCAEVGTCWEKGQCAMGNEHATTCTRPQVFACTTSSSDTASSITVEHTIVATRFL
jgi:hypothetical protein